MKLHDFGDGILIVPVPAGDHGLTINGKKSNRMFAVEKDGKTHYFYWQ